MPGVRGLGERGFSSLTGQDVWGSRGGWWWWWWCCWWRCSICGLKWWMKPVWWAKWWVPPPGFPERGSSLRSTLVSSAIIQGDDADIPHEMVVLRWLAPLTLVGGPPGHGGLASFSGSQGDLRVGTSTLSGAAPWFKSTSSLSWRCAASCSRSPCASRLVSSGPSSTLMLRYPRTERFD